MKAICRICHFLSKEYREANTGRTIAFALTEVEREKLAEGLASVGRITLRSSALQKGK